MCSEIELAIGTLSRGDLATPRKMAAALSLVCGHVSSTGFQRMILVLLLFLPLRLVRVDAQDRSGEVQTLIKFKTTADVGSAALSRGYWDTWNASDETPCGWWGVTCTTTSTVRRLSLSNWGLTNLPNVGVLSNLKNLSELDLSGNNFQSPSNNVSIPDDIASLVQLNVLVLTGCGFSGQIPQSISACKNLRIIHLDFNSLEGEIPDLSGLANLQYLYLRDNLFAGNVPRWLGQMNSLLLVDLANNFFEGIIPSLPNLNNLLEIFFDNNSFTAFEEPVLPDARRLEHLSVSLNQIQGPIPPSLTNFVNMKILRLTQNQFSGPIPTNFAFNMSQGPWIQFDQNQLTGSIPENFLQTSATQAINLPGVNLSNNLLSGPIPFHATSHYFYDTLDFNNNNLSGPIPPICNGNSYVYRFYMENNQFSGDIVDFLIDCYDYMTDMRLSNNSFSGDLSRIANINSTVGDAFAVKERTLLNGYRDFSNNNLQMTATEANPDPLGAVLEHFVLNKSLAVLRMQGNDFSGASLPSNLTLAANYLQVLDLSDNHLKGKISAATFNSTWLPALEFLDLSNNDIRGSLPEAVIMLPKLATLNVANNSLSGELPTIPNRLYNPGWFQGNSKLCGGPLKACSGGVEWWVWLVVGLAALTVLGSCGALTWRYKRYHKIHQQDTDLIRALLEKESASLMTLRELTKATDNFSEKAKIGVGGFGTVYTGKLNDGSRVAIKRSKREGSEKDKIQFLNEVNILSQVSHRHLVKLLGCCMENKIALLVFEFIPNGTLQEHLQGRFGAMRLSWKQRLRIAVQTADALNYLHTATTFPIYHRDVKSANILLDNEYNAKVADFGIAKLAPFEATHVSTMAVQGTLGYIDPEYYATYQLSDKSDVYSFGVVLLELISALPAIDFLRGAEQTGLVNFSKVYIQSGDLRPLIDIALLESYDDVAGKVRDSILNVARLAVECLRMHPKARPPMNEVWKDLEKMWLDLDGKSNDLVSFIDIGYENTGPRRDQIVLFQDPVSCNSSLSTVHDTTTIEMTPFELTLPLR